MRMRISSHFVVTYTDDKLEFSSKDYYFIARAIMAPVYRNSVGTKAHPRFNTGIFILLQRLDHGVHATLESHKRMS